MVDSTGLKIFGTGEWKVRQHWVGKRRTWRKTDLAVESCRSW
ncbi:Mobile element protein [Candidatus Accumulibacter phosphatis]|uniref:Mobile element protein n=1 Tax=Candidatus Accumulibacter phosphatis TaxID=327160 RepID=A0A5S4EQD0_9PROT|nr:Mobile element protein [Candidatus Accumulibacter phosphatis]